MWSSIDRSDHELAGPFDGGIGEAEISRNNVAYIRWVQGALNRILGLRLGVDGITGAQTRSATRRFQQMKGLTADGIVGARTERALVDAGAGQPPGGSGGGGGGVPQPTAGPPALLRRESDPPALSLYLDITLGGEGPARPMTGVFIPTGYRPRPEADLILYLPGHKGRQPTPSQSIDSYWNTQIFRFWPLREALNETSKNAILVAPTLGPRSETGWLVERGGLDRYLERVLQGIGQHAPFPQPGGPPRLRHLVLACHSGGGFPMRQLALSTQASAGLIRECWGFDCTYNGGDDTQWARWAQANPTARLFIYYIPGSATQRLSLQLKRIAGPNVLVAPAGTPIHNAVPITRWRERITGASFLGQS